MLRIYTVILGVLRELRPVVAAIEMHDRDLGRQLRRAATSVALNVQEGSGSHGGTRREVFPWDGVGGGRIRGPAWRPRSALGYVESVAGGRTRSARSREVGADPARRGAASGSRGPGCGRRGAFAGAARAILEALMASGNYQYQSDFARRYVAQGEASGRAHALLAVLAARGIEVPDGTRVQIVACVDLTRLDRDVCSRPRPPRRRRTATASRRGAWMRPRPTTATATVLEGVPRSYTETTRTQRLSAMTRFGPASERRGHRPDG